MQPRCEQNDNEDIAQNPLRTNTYVVRVVQNGQDPAEDSRHRCLEAHVPSIPRGEERHGEFVQKARKPVELSL